MYGAIRDELTRTLESIRAEGLYKPEYEMTSRQGAHVELTGGRDVLNLCANNYLGLAGDPELVEVAKRALDEWGFGLASVRFICGTQTIHTDLERKIADFLGTDDTILYTSCFDANGGLFETLLGPEDAVISDSLNHASIIDGIRLSKAQRYRYENADMADLESQLKAAADARFRLIVTDGVFSMDGYLAPLDRICDLADAYDALVMVDDSHAVGFVGEHGRGTPEHFGVTDRVDIVTGTLGKALGGASGGYTSGRAEIIELLRQRSRPYLFSNSVAPSIVVTGSAVLDRLASGADLRARLRENTAYFRSRMTELGFDVLPGEHPIVPIMVGDATQAGKLSERLMAEGVYAVSFSYPVVPLGTARIRTQMSAAHTREDLDFAIAAFVRASEGLPASQ